MQPVPATEYLEPAPCCWPLVLGILGLLWGGVGFFSAVLALVGAGDAVTPAAMRGGLGTALTVYGSLVAILLVAGCVQLIRRKAAGVQMLQAWVPLAVVVSLAGVGRMVAYREEFEAAIQESLQVEMDRQAEKTGRAAQQFPEGMARTMLGVQLGCAGLIAVVPPIVVAVFVFGSRGRDAVA
jgi:hypothetical protein